MVLSPFLTAGEVVDPSNFGAPSLVIHIPERMSLKYIRRLSRSLPHFTEHGCPPQVNGKFGR